MSRNLNIVEINNYINHNQYTTTIQEPTQQEDFPDHFLHDLQEQETPSSQETFKHDEPIGVPSREKDNNTFRVFGSNPNGLTLGHDGGDFAELCLEMSNSEVDCWCIYETKLDTTQHTVRNKLHDTIRKHTDHSRIVYGSSTISTARGRSYKPGGILQATQGQTTGRVVKQGQDAMGRWAYQVFSCRGHKTLTVITAYQVCQQTIVDQSTQRRRSFTASAQQISMLRQMDRACTPREAFVSDLSVFIQERTACNSGILLIGDFNEALSDSYTGMSKLCSDHNLQDLMWQMVGTTEFGTQVKGRERIDYVLCSDWVAAAARNGYYEAFGYRPKGDHRNIMIDFDTDKLFGNRTQPLGPISSRDFTSQDKSSNRKYIQAKHQYCTDHNVGQRLAALKERWDSDEAEKLDRDWQRAGEFAAKQCSKKPRSVPYVAELAELRKRKNLLLKLISAAKLQKSFDAGIAHLTKDGHQGGFPSSLAECQTECRLTQQKIKAITKTAIYRRQNELRIALQEAIDCGDKQKSKALKHRISAERTKAMYAKLRQCRENPKAGITRLDVPSDNTTTDYNSCSSWITIDTPAEIEERLLQRNRKHFGQADKTFPTVPPFSEWCDWGASTHTAELILEGEWQSDELTAMQQSLVNHMKARVALDTIPDTINTEEWISKIRSWPESTTTSPSGFHLGHSKALISSHDLDTLSPEGESLEQQRSDLIEWQVSLLNCALSNQYSFKRWQHIVNVMILKEPGDLRIHRLRVIHLYEQDYNLVLAIKWRKMIQVCTNQQAIHPTQFGGVPGRDAIIPTLCEEFQYEISRASKRPLVHLDYDATACYDRIVLSFGSLASRSFGQHRSIVFINARTLEQAKYYLKTQLGVSERYYKHCTLYPIYGTGQGAGNSPAIWCVVSSILFETYEEGAHGASFESPDGSIRTKIYMIGFVDDTSGSVNDFRRPTSATPDHYINKAQQDAQRWNDVLCLSGGALNPQKCSYHFMYYDFNIDGLPLLQAGSFGPTITISFNDGTQSSSLSQLSAFKSHKTLGVQKSPYSTNKGLYLALAKRNNSHTKTMARSPFSRTDAWAYYHAIYLPSMSYPFPSSTISDSFCTALQRQFKKAFLPKYGFNRTMPNAVVYGPSELGGIGLRTLSVERGIAQVYHFLACIRSEGVQHQLAKIMVSWGQFLAGTGVPILEDVHTLLPHMDPMQWLPQMRSFLSTVDCRVELEQTFVPDLQREHDAYLMDLALTYTSSPTDLKLINACRIYLGVTFVSDVATPEGSSLTRAAYDGRMDVLTQHRGLIPYQRRPGPKSWTKWRKFLTSLLCSTQQRRLIQPLGKWFFGGSSTFRNWLSYLDRPSSRLFVSAPNGQWLEYRYQGMVFLPTTILHYSVPSTATPAQTLTTGPAKILSSSHYVIPRPLPPIPNTLADHLLQLAPWERSLCSQCTLLCSTEDFSVFLHSPSPLLVSSDGSAGSFVGKFGCVCATENGQRLFRINGPAPGYKTSSFRAESYAFLAILRFLIQSCQFLSCSLPSALQMFTDSESLVKTIQKRLEWLVEFPYSTMTTDWDLQQCISRSLRKFDQLPHICHVRGHQDKYQAYSTLPLPAQLNVDADHAAAEFVYTQQVSSCFAPITEGCHALLHGANGTITSNFRATLRRLATFENLRQYHCTKYDWSESVFESVDWLAHSRAINSHFSRRHFLLKFIHDWLPLGYQKSRYADFYSDTCPLCSTTLETRSHFLQCPNRDWFGNLADDLRSKWHDLEVDPLIRTLLMEFFLSYISQTTPSFPTVPHAYHHAILSQLAIGHEQVFLGRFSSHWAKLQDQYLQSTSLSPTFFSGTRIITATINTIWLHVLALWTRRNHDLHGDSPETIETAAYAQAKREVVALYALKSQVHPHDIILFYDTPELHFSIDTTSLALRNWLNTWRPVILRSASSS